MTAYGEIEIRYPDGRKHRAAVAGESVSIGRDPGNSIVIQDQSIAPHHCELKVAADIVYLVNLDTRIGTQIAGRTVRDREPIALGDSAELQLGGIRLFYRAGNDELTVPMASLSERTQPVTRPISIALEREIVEVYPASSAAMQIVLKNQTTKSQTCDIAVAGLPEGWVNLSQQTTALAAGESSSVFLIIVPALSPEIAPSDMLAEFSVRLQDAPQREIRREFTVRLREYGGLSVAVDPERVEIGQTFHLYLLNQGNNSLRLKLGLRQREAELKVELSQQSVEIAAGQRVQIEGNATGKRRIAGRARVFPIALLAQADNASQYLVAIPAYVVARPYIPRSALAAAAVALFTIALVLGARLLQTPPPVIVSLELSASVAASGTPVEIRWQASNSERIVIEANRIAIAELGGDASSYVLSTDEFIDPVDISLIAVSGEERAIATRVLAVYEPVKIESFVVSRDRLRRHVVERIVIDWQVSGAVALDLSAPDDFDVILDERQPDGSGRVILLGSPTADFRLQLIVEDENGNVAEQSHAISVVDAECTPLRDFPVFSGPDTRYPQTGNAIENVPVLASGIDSGNTWLRVELASGETGWGSLADFSCDDFEPSALKVIEDKPPLPRATITPTAQPTPSAPPSATAQTTAPSAPSLNSINAEA